MKEIETLRHFLRVLANPARQDLLFLFARGGRRSVGEIADQMGLAISTTSEHLAALKRAGVLVAEKEGKTVYYRPDVDGLRQHLAGLNGFLTHCCPGLGKAPK